MGEALRRLGFNRTEIEGWREDAKAWAFDNGVPQGAMLRQLWHEWSWFEKSLIWDHGVGLSGRGNKIDRVRPKFDPMPLFRRPDEWVPPWERYPDSNVLMVPSAPPAARIVHLWLGAFTYESPEQ